MKRIPLKDLPDPERPNDPNGNIDYVSVIRNVIRRPKDPQKGADIEELRKGIRVLDALDRCDHDVLVLEDSDWQHLVEKTKAMPWGLVDKRVVMFIDDVTEAHEVASATPDGLLAPT